MRPQHPEVPSHEHSELSFEQTLIVGKLLDDTQGSRILYTLGTEA